MNFKNIVWFIKATSYLVLLWSLGVIIIITIIIIIIVVVVVVVVVIIIIIIVTIIIIICIPWKYLFFSKWTF